MTGGSAPNLDKMVSLLDSGDTDPKQDILVCDLPPASGKTYAATDAGEGGLLAWFNRSYGMAVRPCDCYLLEPRKDLYKQVLADATTPLFEVESWRRELGDFDKENQERIRIAAYHSWSIDSGEGLPKRPSLFVFDEAHCLAADTFVFQSFFALKKLIASRGKTVFVIFLTATPQPLLYLGKDEAHRHETLSKCFEQFGFSFARINKKERPKYQVGQFYTVRGKTISTAYKHLRGDGESKAAFFCQNAKDAVKIGREDKHAQIVISRYNTGEDQAGAYVDVMDEAKNEELLRTKRLPASVHTLIGTSVIHAGVNLEDPLLERVAIESELPHEIIQAAYRFRQDVPEVFILQNGNRYKQSHATEENTFKALGSVRESGTEEEAQGYLRCLWDSEKRDSETLDKKSKKTISYAPFVGKWNGRYEVDYSVFAYFLYLEDCHFAASNYSNKRSRTIEFCGKETPLSEEYFAEMVGDCSANKPKPYEFTKETFDKVVKCQLESVDMDAILAPYLGKKLRPKSAEREALINVVPCFDSYGSRRGWTTAKKRIEAAGFVVQDKRDKESNYTLITKN